MRFRLVSCAVVLCALPASGDNSLLNPRTVTALTSIDAVPTTSGLNNAFNSPDAALVDLEVLARDPSVDLGIAIRAIRALPGYCPPQNCGTGTGIHETLILVISDYLALPQPAGAQALLRLRAAIEALGVTRAVLDADVDLMLPLLHHLSRDVRATVVRALRGCCNDRAKAALKALKLSEPTMQVQFALLSALQDFEQCPGP